MENAAAFASGASTAIAPVHAYPGGMRVLAVEEDPVYLTTLTQMLQRHGYQVTAKASPEEGLRELRENPEGFDLVMTVVRTQGPGIDGFELLRHAAERHPVILFSGVETGETMMRGMLGGACAFLTKPLRDEDVRDVWQHVVVRRRLNAASAGGAAAVADTPSPSSDVVFVRQDGTARKRGLDDSDEGGWAAKRTKFTWSPELHPTFVKAAEQLRGTQDYCPRGIQDLLEVQGVQLTIEQVTSHLEKYRRDCLNNYLSSMPMASSSHPNISKNYLTPGSSGFSTRPQGAANINQTSLLNNGASPVGCGILGHESCRPSHVGLLYNNDNRHGNANGNCSGEYGNGYDYQYGNGNGNDNANANGFHNGNGRGGILVADGSMVSASLSSNLAQPVQQAMPTNSLFPSSMVHTMDNPNTIEQHAFPQTSGLRYDGNTGGISMLPWPVDDDGEELLRSYMEADNEVMVTQNATSTCITQGMHGDGVVGQISTSQPQDLTDPLSSGSGNGTAGTSGGSGIVTDGILDHDFSADEMERFLS